MLHIWKDKRHVRMISTIHCAKLQDTGWVDRKKENVKKPICIIDYNKHLKGVDRADQCLSYNSFLGKP